MDILERIKGAIEAVKLSEDDTGCAGDLTVVSKSACEALFSLDGDIQTAIDIAALTESYGLWGEHPDYPRGDWAFEGMQGDTNRGYWEWVAVKIEAASMES